MKVEDIIKLIDAGYTKEDIQSMSAPEKEPEPAPAPAPAPAPDPAPAPAADTAQNDMSAMLQELKDLKRAVYAMNVMNTEAPAQKSVDDILAAAMKGGN